METLEELTQAIMSDEQNKVFTEQGIKPLFTIPKTARINIVGQAPGIRAQESGLYWNDPSGDNLRDWMGVSREEFYESGMFALNDNIGMMIHTPNGEIRLHQIITHALSPRR